MTRGHEVQHDVVETVLALGLAMDFAIERVQDDLPAWAGLGAGVALLLLVAAYLFGSWLHLRPFRIGAFHLHYPRLPIVARQLIIGPLEILAAISIIYFALPEAGNPGFLIVLGIFLASFSAALLSHAPGGLGVLEVLFITCLPEIDPAAVLAALLVFRLFYLIIPLALSLIVVLLFEKSQLQQRTRDKPILHDPQSS